VAYVGNQPARGQWRKLTDISASFDGVLTTFTTSVPPGTSEYYVTAGSASQLLVSLGGVIQQPDVDYTVSTNSITFTTPPTGGLSFFGVLCGDALNVGAPADGSVTTSKLAGSLSVGLTGGSASTPALFFTGDANTGIFSPAADTIAFAEGGAEAARIDSSGRLLVGTTTATANGGVLELSGGITFPATAVAATDPNTLDDYEEGTFTPTIVGTTLAGTGTYSFQLGRYTKVGKLVSFQLYISWSAHTGTGNMKVEGLPFVNVNATGAQSPVAVAPSNLTFSNSLSAFTFQNSTQVLFRTYATGGAEADLPIDIAAAIRLAGVYEAD
jgi:hypothetical protein